MDDHLGGAAPRRLRGERRRPTPPRARRLPAISACLALTAGLTACAPPLLVRRSATIPLAPCDPGEPAVSERPRAIAGGDLDGDGHGDLVIVSADPIAENGAFARARVIWWDERGACLSPAYDAWSAPPPLTAWDVTYARRPRPPLTAAMVAEVLDVDGDGRLDLLSADAATLELAVAYGRGDRASPFEPPSALRVDDPPAIIPASDLPATRPSPRSAQEVPVRVCPSTLFHWLALGDSEAAGRHDLRVNRRGLIGSCSPGALLFTAEGERGFAAGRFVDEYLAPAVPPHSRRYGNIFATNASDHVSLEDGEITLHEGIIVNQDQGTTRALRARQPFAAELVVVADLGERRPRYYGAQTRPEDPPIHRVIIADERRVAVLRDNPADLSWRWTIFELP